METPFGTPAISEEITFYAGALESSVELVLEIHVSLFLTETIM